MGLNTKENLMAVKNFKGEVLIRAITKEVKTIVFIRLYLFKLTMQTKKVINTTIFAKGLILFKKQLASERLSNVIRVLSLVSNEANFYLLILLIAYPIDAAIINVNNAPTIPAIDVPKNVSPPEKL